MQQVEVMEDACSIQTMTLLAEEAFWSKSNGLGQSKCSKNRRQ